MAEIVAATAADVLEAVASAPAQGAQQSTAEWLAEAQFQRIVQETGAQGAYDAPVYKWNYDPAADEAFSRLVDETSADGAWEAWKDGGGNVSPGGSASPNPTVKASPQTAIKKPAAAGASVGGLLSMSLPTWTAAVAPLLGVAVGVGLYELSPELWEKISRTLLPFCYDDTQCLPVVTDEDGNTYVDKEAVEALKNLFDEEGIGGSSSEYTHEGDVNFDSVTVKGPVSYAVIQKQTTVVIGTASAGGNMVIVNSSPYDIKVTICDGKLIVSAKSSWSRGSVVVRYYDAQGNVSGSSSLGNSSYTYSSNTVRYSSTVLTGTATCPSTNSENSGKDQYIAWTMEYTSAQQGGNYPDGTAKWNGNTVDLSQLPITDVYTDPVDDTKTRDFIPVALPTQPGTSVDSTDNPDPSTNSDPETQISPYIWPSIPSEQYPDGSETEETQDLDKNAPIPLPMPSPNPTPDTEADPSYPSEDPPQQLIDIIPPTDIGGTIPFPNMPVGGDPSNVDGGVGGLVSVYNPTYAELQAFSQWLWVTYADATIDKIWNNPFDGIISLHELYVTPDKGAKKYIKSGFLVSPVECDTVPNRYTEINCGSAIVPEYYGNYLDYSPYSKALCYLPFIGIVELNVDDIVGHAINIKYRVDSYSGACIALIECAKEGATAVLYQFTGNCSVQLPIAGGTQAAIKAAQLSAGAYQNAYHIAGVAGLVGGIASGAAQIINGVGSGIAQGLGGHIGGGIATGIGGIASGAASIIQGVQNQKSQEAFGNAAAVSQTVSAKSSVQHSGQFGESFGAMGAKQPYLIIKRPVQVIVPNYQNEYGYPAHKYVTIGECTGYLRCRGVHVNSARATDSELQLIEEILSGGVFVT